MINKTKRLLVFSLFTIIMLVFNVNLLATDIEYTEVYVDGDANKFGRYHVKETTDFNSLPFGVKHYTDRGYASAGAGMCTSSAAGFGNQETFVAGEFYPQQVNVVEIPSTTDVEIRTWVNLTPTQWNAMTVRNVANDFETNNPGYRVIAAINADFYDNLGHGMVPYTTTGSHISNGEHIKAVAARNLIGFKNDGSTNSLVGNEAITRTNMILGVYNNDNEIIHELTINKVNQTPQAGEIAIYFPMYDNLQKIQPITVENAYNVISAEQVYPYSHDHFYGRGMIASVGSATLGEGDFAIISNNPQVSTLLGEGIRIRAQYEFAGAYAGIKEGTGIGEIVLADRVPTATIKNRGPRTLVGMKEDGTILMTTIDGRQANKNMYGATQIEMSAIMTHYGAVDAYELDGGGSTTMAILKDGEFVVVNSPSDGHERLTANALLVVVRVPSFDFNVSDVTDNGFTINAEVVDYNGFDFDEFYIGVGDNIKKVENGKVTFTNLDSNTFYNYQFYQKIDDQFQIFPGLGNRQITTKQLPQIVKARLMMDSGDLYLDFQFNDPDNAISRREVIIGEQSALISSFPHRSIISDFNGSLYNVKIKLRYNLNDGSANIEQYYDDFIIHCGAREIIIMSSEKISNRISKIYE